RCNAHFEWHARRCAGLAAPRLAEPGRALGFPCKHPRWRRRVRHRTELGQLQRRIPREAARGCGSYRGVPRWAGADRRQPALSGGVPLVTANVSSRVDHRWLATIAALAFLGGILLHAAVAGHGLA